MFNSLLPHGLYLTRLLCPQNSPGKNTGVDSHFLLQGILLTQGLNPSLPYCRQILTVYATREAPNQRIVITLFFYVNKCTWVQAKSLQLCPTLFDPMDCSPSGSSTHGIFQARILEWVALPSSRGSFQPRDKISISYVFCIGRQILYHQHHVTR